MKELDLSAFAEITKRVIARRGFDGYLPTLCFPARKHMIVLEGVPDEKLHDIRDIAMAWATKEASADEEYFLAYKEDGERFRIVHRSNGGTDEEVFSVATSPRWK